MGRPEHGWRGMLQGAAGALRWALVEVPQRGIRFVQAELAMLGKFRRLAVIWIVGVTALILTTLVFFQVGLNATAAALGFLIVIVFLSLLDSFISSAIFSVAAILCLNYFFVEPLFTLQVADTQDLVALAAFLLTSLAVTSLIRRVRELQGGQREQAGLLDLTSDAVIVRDLNDVITYWGRGAEALYGWTREEAVGKVANHLLKSVLPAPYPEIAEILMHTGRWEGELVHTARDGRVVTVASRWSLQHNEQGQPVGVLASNIDITERKRVEEALQRSHAAYLAEAQRLSRTGSFGWNLDTGEIFWSEETFRIFGYEPGGKPTLELARARVHPDDVENLFDRVNERAAREKQGFDVEHRLLMPDGSVKHLHVVAHAIHNGHEQLVGAISDITARKEAFAAVERSEHRYRHLFNHMPIALLQVDGQQLVELFRALRADGITDLAAQFDADPGLVGRCLEAMTVKDVNEHSLMMFGARGPDDLVDRTAGHFWRADMDAFRRAMTSRFGGETYFEMETKIATLDGRVVDVLFTTSRLGPVGDASINLIGMIDISDRVRAQERLQRVQADFAHAARISVLGELTASIAHEINQPLAAIATNGEVGLRWLGRPDPNLTELRELTESVVADARRAADIIARVRSMAARRTPEHVSLSLDNVIREALLFLRHEVQARAVNIVHEVGPVAYVLGDRTQLQQVLVNLTINAMQAMAQAGSPRRRIVIRTTTPNPGTVRCSVEDSGPGVKAEHIQRLFESFFTTKDGGMGMGLPICRSIIEEHGGRIVADNASTEGGARFSFTLPIAAKPN